MLSLLRLKECTVEIEQFNYSMWLCTILACFSSFLIYLLSYPLYLKILNFLHYFFYNSNIVWWTHTFCSNGAAHPSYINSVKYLWYIFWQLWYTAIQIKNHSNSICSQSSRCENMNGATPINYHLKSEVSIVLHCHLGSTCYTAMRIKNLQNVPLQSKKPQWNT